MTKLEKLFADKTARINQIGLEIRALNAERRKLYREVNAGTELLTGILSEAGISGLDEEIEESEEE